MGTPGSFTWSRTDMEMEALKAREARFFMKGRVLDKSSKVSGKKYQAISIPETEKVYVRVVGAGGSVTPSVITPSVVTLTIDLYKEASRDFEDIDEEQEVYDKKKDFSWQAGDGHGRDVEDTLLALETGITAVANRISIASDVSLATIVQGRVVLDNADVPQEQRYAYFSAGQAGALVQLNDFKNLDFIGQVKAKSTPTQSGILPAMQGFSPLWGTRCRRRSVSGTTRTINMLFQKEWAACGVQQGLTTKITDVDLAKRHMITQLYGVVRTRVDHIVILQTVNA